MGSRPWPGGRPEGNNAGAYLRAGRPCLRPCPCGTGPAVRQRPRSDPEIAYAGLVSWCPPKTRFAALASPGHASLPRHQGPQQEPRPFRPVRAVLCAGVFTRPGPMKDLKPVASLLRNPAYPRSVQRRVFHGCVGRTHWGYPHRQIPATARAVRTGADRLRSPSMAS